MNEKSHAADNIDDIPLEPEVYDDIQEQPPVEELPTQTQQSTVAPVTKDELFMAPKDSVTLPSFGKVYPVGSSLYGKRYVEVRHLTAADEDVLTSRSLLRTGKAIDTLLANCLVDKTINPEQLLSGDKNAILTYLRVSGYGPEYKVEIDCPACAESVKYEFDMSTLEMTPLDLDPVVEGENRFGYTLPSGDYIEFKFLNSAEEKEISDTLERVKKATSSPIDKNITTRLKNQIISINNNTDLPFINNYVDSMPVRDSRAFRSHLENNNPDVIMKQDFACPHCGDSQEVDIPISVSFFWPGA